MRGLHHRGQHHTANQENPAEAAPAQETKLSELSTSVLITRVPLGASCAAVLHPGAVTGVTDRKRLQLVVKMENSVIELSLFSLEAKERCRRKALSREHTLTSLMCCRRRYPITKSRMPQRYAGGNVKY